MSSSAAALILAIASTAANHQKARIGAYAVDVISRVPISAEQCKSVDANFNAEDGFCYLTVPDGRTLSISNIGNQFVVRVELHYRGRSLTEFTGVVVDKYRDSLVVQSALLRDPRANAVDENGFLRPVIEKAGRESCWMRIDFRPDGKIDTVPNSRCSSRLALTGATKKN